MVYLYSTIKMMHGPINIRIRTLFCRRVYALCNIRCCKFHFKTDAEITQPYFSRTLHFTKDYTSIISSNLSSNDSFAVSSVVINTRNNLCFSLRPCSVRSSLPHTSYNTK